MATKQILCVGHLVYDIRDYVNSFPQPDKSVFMRMPSQFGPGGSAANVAMNCVKLGHTAGLISNVGADMHGKFLINELRARGVDKREVKQIKSGRTGLSIILIDSQGQVMVIEDPGCVDAPRKISPKPFSNSNWVHMTGCTHSWLEQASSYAHKAGVPLSFDPGRAAARMGIEKLSRVIERVDFLVLNRKELAALSGSGSALEVKDLAREFNCTVVLKTGHGPAVVSQDGKSTYEVPPFNAKKVVDTLGAGDAFASGLICGKLEGRSTYESVKMAHACAAAKVMHAGAQGMPKKAAVKKEFSF
ncbi:MAG: carbohydrate kinase family protein [Candidatus Micrarchaeia archaeon]